MTSHTYNFGWKDLLRAAGLPLLPVLLFPLLMHLGARSKLLPQPRPTLDVDRTILINKIEASSAQGDAQILLLGDSSCLIDVSAVQLGAQLGEPVLNLGTLSYLDLESHATLLRRFAAANPNQLKAVVLLLHPEALRRPVPESYHTTFVQSFITGQDHTARPTISQWAGLEIFRGRLLSRAVPTALSGAYGRYYHFSDDLDRYLIHNRGTAVDPDPQPFKGNPEYRLAPQLEARSRAFKAAVPPQVKLLVVITPVPEEFVGTDYPQSHRAMLSQWREWLQADSALEQLPAALPGRLFTSTTHLNEAGTRIYTDLLARALLPHLK